MSERIDSKLDTIRKDVTELARAINTQAQLLNAVVNAADHIVKTYVSLTTVKGKENEKTETPKA
jgi:hypothetical protein